MAGLSSLGIGSGVLTGETMDKLREADEKSTVVPIQKKIVEEEARRSAIKNMDKPVADLKTVSDYLNDFSTYQKRTASSGANSAVDATVGIGFPLGDMQVDVHQLASASMFAMGGHFTSRDDIYSKTGTNLELTQGGRTYHIPIRGGMKVGEVAQAITDATDGKIVGQVMRTNGPSPFRLIVKSAETGEDNRIYTGSHYASTLDEHDGAGEMTINHGDMIVHLTDATGTDHAIDIADYLGTGGVYKIGTAGATAPENLESITKDLRAKLLTDADFKDVVVDPTDKSTFNRPIEITLRRQEENAQTPDPHSPIPATPTPVEMILNDKRGSSIGVGGSSTFLAHVGLKEKTADLHKIQSAKDVGSGHILGKLTIGGVAMDLGTITAAGNSSDDNATAIANFINAASSTVVSASTDKGKLVLEDLTTAKHGVQIIIDSTDEPNSSKAIKAIGFMPGLNQGYASSINYDVATGKYAGAFGREDMSHAQDAKFSFNGMEMTRGKNKVDDILGGLTLDFKKVTTSAEVIKVKRDSGDLAKKITGFFNGLNDIFKALNGLTKNDPNAYMAHASGRMNDEDYYKRVGLFSTNSNMRTLTRQVREMFSFSMAIAKDPNAKVEYDKSSGERMISRKNLSLVDFGITATYDNSEKITNIEINEDKLKEALKDNEEYLDKFFYGYDSKNGSKEEHTKGYFETVSTDLHKYFYDPKSTFKSMSENTRTKLDSMHDEEEKATDRLNAKYKTMQERWAQYDVMINQMQQSFGSIQQMINQGNK